MDYIYRLPGALILSWLVGSVLTIITPLFTHVTYVCLGEILQNLFSFATAEVIRGVAINQVLPGLGTLSTIESPRWTILLLLIGVTIALTILGFIFVGIIKLVKGNKVLATLCSLILLWQFYICIKITYVHPYTELTFWFCTLSGIILLIYLVLIIFGAFTLFTNKDFD